MQRSRAGVGGSPDRSRGGLRGRAGHRSAESGLARTFSAKAGRAVEAEDYRLLSTSKPCQELVGTLGILKLCQISVKFVFCLKDARPARWEPPGGGSPVRAPVGSFLEKSSQKSWEERLRHSRVLSTPQRQSVIVEFQHKSQ